MAAEISFSGGKRDFYGRLWKNHRSFTNLLMKMMRTCGEKLDWIVI